MNSDIFSLTALVDIGLLMFFAFLNFLIVTTIYRMLRPKRHKRFKFEGAVLGASHGDFHNDPVKGWVTGGRTAVVSYYDGLKPGHCVAGYDYLGKRHLRTVVTVDKLIEDLEGDIRLAVVGTDVPWPVHMTCKDLEEISAVTSSERYPISDIVRGAPALPAGFPPLDDPSVVQRVKNLVAWRE